jgi:hypothetical protein
LFFTAHLSHPLFFSRVAWSILDCARPTTGVRDRALREHRRSSGSIPSLFREQEDDQATHPTLLGRALCEHGDRHSYPSTIFSILLGLQDR